MTESLTNPDSTTLSNNNFLRGLRQEIIQKYQDKNSNQLTIVYLREIYFA